MVGSGGGIARLIGGIFTLVSLVLLAVGGYLGNRQYTILQTWPTAEATVTKSEIIEGRDSEGHRMFSPAIDFRYTVDGKDCETPVSSNYSTSDFKEVKRKVEQYAPGTRHLIRYNPQDPLDIKYDVSMSFGFFFAPVLLGAMGIVFAAFGVPILIAGLREKSRECSACGAAMDKGQTVCPKCGTAVAVE